MRKHLFTILSLLFSITVLCQQDLDALVKEGVSLHDNGQYDEALKKYDAVLTVDRNHYLANYEKSYTLLALQRYDECIEILKFLLKNFPDNNQNAGVYINYGTCLDLLGRSKQAVEAYNDGIKKFPKEGLLYFNKAITLYNTNNTEDAIEAAKLSIQHNPYHASSHNLMSVLNKSNKIYSLLTSLVFLAIEPDGKRAAVNLNNVQNILNGGAKKTGDNSVSIFLDMSSLKESKKKKDDDFHSIELLVRLGSGLDYDEKYKDETPVERLKRKLESVISMLDETEKSGRGFGWTYYAPFFVKLKKADFLETFCHIIYSSANDATNTNWLVDNKNKVDEFNSWFRDYWKKG